MLEIKNGIVRLHEWTGGTRGATYWYIEENGELIHVSERFGHFRKHMEKSKRKEHVVYEIPVGYLKGSKLFEFSFSNKGYGPYTRVYEIDDSVKEKSGDVKALAFKIDDLEVMKLIREYLQFVPAFVKRIKDIEEKLGFQFNIKAPRLDDIYKDPENAYKTALIFPKNNGRIRALESYIQTVHELYVLSLVFEALGGKVYSPYGDRSIWLEKASDYPTAIVDNKTTCWYQFSVKRWLDVVFAGLVKAFGSSKAVSELQKKAMKGEFEVFERLFGIKPKDTKEAYEMIGKIVRTKGRQYVMPDITVFEGVYRSRDELKENPSKKILVIDAKYKLSDFDVEQIKRYKEIFDGMFPNSKIGYVVACLKDAVHFKQIFREEGITAIERVAPNQEGEIAFRNFIQNFF